MKWISLLVLTLALIGQVSSQQMRLMDCEGGSSTMLSLRNPFWRGESLVSGCTTLYFNVTSPVNGSVLYFPDNTIHLRYNITGASSPICYYTAGGGRNNMTCGNGVNEENITLPGGETWLNVYVNDSCGDRFQGIFLNVITPTGGYYLSPMTWLMVGIFLFFIMVIQDDNVRRSI